jgi:hypothetical protein
MIMLVLIEGDPPPFHQKSRGDPHPLHPPLNVCTTVNPPISTYGLDVGALAHYVGDSHSTGSIALAQENILGQ